MATGGDEKNKIFWKSSDIFDIALGSVNLRVQDFRGISISSILSKIFEHCILNRYANFLMSSVNQFDLKEENVMYACNLQYEAYNRAV